MAKGTTNHGLYGRRLRKIFILIACCFILIFSGLTTVTFNILQHSHSETTFQNLASTRSDSVRVVTSTIDSALRTLQLNDASMRWGGSTTAAEYYSAAADLHRHLSRAITDLSVAAYDIHITQNNRESFFISSSGSRSKDLFFSQNPDLSWDEWDQISSHFETSSQPYILPIYNEQRLKTLYYIVLQRTTGENLLYLVEIPIETLCGKDTNQKYAICDRDNLLAYNSLDSSVKESLDKDFAYIQENGTSLLNAFQKFSYKHKVIFHIRTFCNPISLVYEYDDSLMLQPQLVIILILSIFLFSGLSLLIFTQLSEKLYNPFREAIPTVDSSNSGEEPVDEFDVIQKNTKTIIQLNDELQNVTRENGALTARRYYRELLSGIPDLDCPLSAEQMSAEYCVAIIELENDNSPTDENDLTLHLQKNQLSLFAQSLCNEMPLSCFGDNYNTCAVILQTDNRDKAAEILSRFFEMPNLTMDLRIALSDVHESVLHICEGYQEAMHLLEYRYSVPERSIITSDISSTPSHDSYYYPLVIESRIIQEAALGDPVCLTLYDDIIRQNRNNTKLFSSAYQRLTFALAGTLMRVFQELKTTPIDLLGYEPDLQSMLYAQSDFTQAAGQIRSCLESILSHVHRQRSNPDDVLLKKMLDFITQNYSDDIMLVDIAEHCGISPNYCSTLFKRLSNDNFKTFLNRYRIDRACEMLQNNPHIKINDLCTEVGFNSASSFIRVFSKMTGMTPKAYAEKTAQEKE